MSALAKFVLSMGKIVAGSDIGGSVYIDELISCGISVDLSNNKKSIEDYEVIIYTDAIKPADKQLAEAKEKNKVILSRGRLLYEISRNFDTCIAVSGCHGKTTCTAMLAHILNAANVGFGLHVGGRDLKFSNAYYSGNSYFLTEACEYKKNLLLLKPDISVVLNTDPDHLECYGTAENLLNAYKSFIDCANIKVALFGSINDSKTKTFGFDTSADFRAENCKCNLGKYSFDVLHKTQLLGNVSLNVYGKHNILNALAAVAVSISAEVPFEAIKAGLQEFSGVERRFELLGEYNGAKVIADYAHHPDELFATIKTANEIGGRKLFVIFQPHTYSRTKNLFNEFINVLMPLERLLIYRTFAAREYFDDSGSALTLSQHIKKSRYGDDERDICDFLSECQDGDIALVLGAGDIYDICKKIVKNQS